MQACFLSAHLQDRYQLLLRPLHHGPILGIHISSLRGEGDAASSSPTNMLFFHAGQWGGEEHQRGLCCHALIEHKWPLWPVSSSQSGWNREKARESDRHCRLRLGTELL